MNRVDRTKVRGTRMNDLYGIFPNPHKLSKVWTPIISSKMYCTAISQSELRFFHEYY